MGHALPQSLSIRIVQAAHFGRHTGGEHVVHALNNFRAGTEIVAQQNFSALPRLCLLHRRVRSVLFQKNAGVSQAELVDGLLHVAHQEAVLLLPAEGGENRVLHGVGVLILVHQNLPEAAADFRRRSRGIGAALSQQQIQSIMLQIAEIQNPAASLNRPVIPGKLLNKGCQSPRAGRGLPQIVQHLGRLVRKVPKLFIQALLAAVAGRFYPVRQFRVPIFLGEHQPAVVDGPGVYGFVPAVFLPQGFQLVEGVPQIDGGFFHAVARIQGFCALPQHPDLAVEIVVQVL